MFMTTDNYGVKKMQGGKQEARKVQMGSTGILRPLKDAGNRWAEKEYEIQQDTILGKGRHSRGTEQK